MIHYPTKPNTLPADQIALEWCRGGWDVMSKDDYETLKASGMLWEFYPDAPFHWGVPR